LSWLRSAAAGTSAEQRTSDAENLLGPG